MVKPPLEIIKRWLITSYNTFDVFASDIIDSCAGKDFLVSLDMAPKYLAILSPTDCAETVEYYVYEQLLERESRPIGLMFIAWIDTCLVCGNIAGAIQVRKLLLDNGFPLSQSMCFDEVSARTIPYFVEPTIDTFFDRASIPRNDVVALIRGASGSMWPKILSRINHVEFFNELIEEVILSEGVKWIFPLPKVSTEQTLCWHYASYITMGSYHKLSFIPFTNPRLVDAARKVMKSFGVTESTTTSTPLTPKLITNGLYYRFMYIQNIQFLI